MDRRTQLISVFADTQLFYTEDPALAAAVSRSRAETRLYGADEYPDLPIPGPAEQARHGAAADTAPRLQRVSVTKEKTFEAAMRLHRQYPDKKIAVLNFASATRPGGGVKTGSSAQEESLCRCSTLYPTIDRRWLWEKYYDVNRAAADVLHTDACIYSPGVIICKTDEQIPRRMQPSDWVTVDVISCAAPNLREEPANFQNPETGAPVRMDPMRLYELHKKRAEHILAIAAANEADVLVLGAFGCGAFANDPVYVARACRAALAQYRARFDEIVFAVYCGAYETENYRAFASEFSGGNPAFQG